jgi:phosphohistidine swiveling domain-containing protein
MKLRKEDYLSEDWYFQGFHAVPAFIHHGPTTAIAGMHRELGYCYEKILFIYDGDFLEFGYPAKSMNNVGKIILRKHKKNKNYVHWMIRKYEERQRLFPKFIKKFYALEHAKLTKKQLIDYYHELFQIYSLPLDFGHCIEGFSYLTEDMIKQGILKKIAGREKEFKNYMTVLFQPIRPSFVNEEQTDLLKIMKLISGQPALMRSFKKDEPKILLQKLKQYPAILKKLDQHTEEFYWYQNDYTAAKWLANLSFIERIKEIFAEKNPDIGRQLRESKQAYVKNMKEKEKAIKELGLDQELIRLIHLTEVFMHWQDDRKRNMIRCVLHLSHILKLIANKYDYPYELLVWMTPEEVTLDRMKHLNLQELKERSRSCIFLFEEGPNFTVFTHIYTGAEAAEIRKTINEKRKSAQADELTGTCASMGKFIGRVKIVRTINEARDFIEGDILVAPMTRPEYVPLMKKAAAIVTDEGGITSHAAIVSRELGIPCVIGTQVATKMLHDGDIVEVNADHSRVKILKRNK